MDTPPETLCDIETQVDAGELTAAATFTKMRDLVLAALRNRTSEGRQPETHRAGHVQVNEKAQLNLGSTKDLARDVAYLQLGESQASSGDVPSRTLLSVLGVMIDHDLRPVHGFLLLAVRIHMLRGKAITRVDLAQKLCVDASNVTNLTKRLEGIGWLVQQRQGTGKKARIEVLLTKEGMDVTKDWTRE